VEHGPFDVLVQRYTSTIDLETFIYAFGGEPASIELDLDKTVKARIIKKIESTLEKRERAKVAAQLFQYIQDQDIYLPIIQFEFSGCYSPKWANTQTPFTGYLDQIMNEVTPVEK
jgi:hypothetical protein